MSTDYYWTFGGNRLDWARMRTPLRIFASMVLAALMMFGTRVEAQGMNFDTEMNASIVKLQEKLTAQYGEAQKSRIERGLKQVAQMWRTEDGTPAEFESFVTTYFAGTEVEKDKLFKRFEKQIEQIDGHNTLILLSLREQVDLDLGPIEPVDLLFSGFDPAAHLMDDYFKTKLAHIVLLNFPLTTLEERIANGNEWTRRQWAQARLASRFSKRIPADVQQKIAKAFADAEAYVAGYQFYMHHILDENGERPFASGLRLLSHWDLRDEIRGLYSSKETTEQILSKQRMIQTIMEAVIQQTVPAAVIDNPNLDWSLASNEVAATTDGDEVRPDKADVAASSSSEGDMRYEILLNVYKASKLADPYSPTAATMIDRRFNEDREIPEERFRAILVEVLTAPEVAKIGERISENLKRPLEPFDIWYTGFQARGTYPEAQLDKICKHRYPTAKSFEEDIPNILIRLGFPEEKAKYIGAQIAVDPARGSGHAFGATLRYEKAHLRTDVGADGLSYKGFNTAMHELGHCVEQTISLHWIDEYLLHGVPNTAFTEGMAFVFQGKDMEMLGLKKPNKKSLTDKALNDLWMTYEIAGVALVDIDVWHWMYENPDATPAQLKEAVIRIAKEHWNRYYAPVLGHEDCILLAIYSHMLHCGLYLPDYPLGHIVASQVEHHIEKVGKIGPEIERMDLLGCIAPDLWMQQATGSPVSARPMIEAAAAALKGK